MGFVEGELLVLEVIRGEILVVRRDKVRCLSRVALSCDLYSTTRFA
jgi:hypothetical protein